MRVKLSYTVEEEEVPKEAAKLINLSADDMGQCIGLYNEVQEELKGKEGQPPNTIKALEMIEEFRKALLSVDTRLSEVTDIIDGYDTYRRDKIMKAPPSIEEENDYSTEMFGAD